MAKPDARTDHEHEHYGHEEECPDPIVLKTVEALARAGLVTRQDLAAMEARLTLLLRPFPSPNDDVVALETARLHASADTLKDAVAHNQPK